MKQNELLAREALGETAWLLIDRMMMVMVIGMLEVCASDFSLFRFELQQNSVAVSAIW